MASRPGFSAVYTIIAMLAMVGLVSFGVEVGRVYTAKTELQTAADAAVRAAAAALNTSPAAARSAAIDFADDNTCDGNVVALLNADIELGSWDASTRVFTPVSGGAESSATAVRVTAKKIAARDTAIPLIFAKLIGKSSFDIQAVAVATRPTSGQLGVIGIGSVHLDSNARVDSYNSANGSYSSGSATPTGHVYSNGNITLASNAVINGNATPGPGHTATGGTVTGSRTPASSVTSYPLVDASPYASNNNNSVIPSAYKQGPDFVLDGNIVYSLPAGTYYFRDFRMLSNTRLNITGPTIIYLTGALLLDSNATIVAARPQDLRFNVDGAGPIELKSNSVLNAVLYAPEADFTLDSNFEVLGAVVANNLTIKSGAKVHFDTSLNTGPGSQLLRLVL